MGGSLSVQENAYKQLSRELKGQSDDYMPCINTFVANFEPFDVDFDLPSLQAKEKNTPSLMIEILQTETRGSKIDSGNVSSILRAIEYIMCLSNAYITAAENSGEVINSLLDILRKKDHLSAECVATAIRTLHSIIFRRFCKNQNKYDMYQQSFRSAFDNSKGYQVVSSCLNWSQDDNYTVCVATCSFFNDMLNTHREEQTCSSIQSCLTSISPFMSYLSILTTELGLSPIQLLLKSMLVCCSRTDLHNYQLMFLQNGSFLFHLYNAIQVDTTEIEFSREFIMACVTDSAEGYRVLTRIFPTPLTKKLDVQKVAVRFKDISYAEPLVEEVGDSDFVENMALTTVFLPQRANWNGFWKSLSLENQTYNFIWNTEMKSFLLSAIRSELDDIRVQEEKGSVSWDYDGFRIQYPQLEEYICVDGYYLQQLIDVFVKMESGEQSKVELIEPADFIRHLGDSFIVSRDMEEKRGMFYLIYQVVKAEEEACQNFPIMRYICFLLEEELDPAIEYYCLQILAIICKKQRNTEQFVDYNGLSCLSVSLLYAIQQMVNEQPSISIESSHYNLPTLTISPLDRIRLIIQIIKHSCDSMLRIRNELISEPVLSRLLRCLFTLKDEVVCEDIISILSLSLASSTKHQSTVYKSGLFRILLYFSCGENGMSNEIAQLLYKYHLVQEAYDIQSTFYNANEKVDILAMAKNNKDMEQRVEFARKYSFLRFFLPVPMIALLTREGPSRFREVFNSQQSVSADVIWDEECRLHLYSQIHSNLLSYSIEITKDPSVEWEYTVPEVITYSKIDNLLYIHCVFLDCYCNPETSLPETVDPVGFLNDLVKELDLRFNMLFNMKGKMENFTYEDINLILHSILKLIRLNREISKIDKHVFTVLGRCFAADLAIPQNQDIVLTTYEIILEALQPASFGKPSPYNVYEAADANLINSLDTILVHLTNPDFTSLLADTENVLYQIFSKTMECISILAGKSTPRALESLVINSSFIHHLIHFLILDNLELYPSVSLQVLKAFESFLQEEKLLEVTVNCGIIIFSLYIVICYDGESEEAISIIKTAVKCIELLAGIGISFLPSKTVMDSLTQMLTPGLIKSLRNHHFLTDIRSMNIRNPILIWNQDMAHVLLGLLEDEIDKILDSTSTITSYWNAQAFCHPDSYLHIYLNLLDEIIVDEVYLLPFLDHPDTPLIDPTPEHFLKGLLTFVAHLESSHEVGFRQDKSLYLEHLQICLNSIEFLLHYHSELQPSFINDSNIRRVFVLLKDTTTGLQIQNSLLSLLETGVDTSAGCSILASFIPDLCTVLDSKNNETQMSVLHILKQFIQNDNNEVIHLIMSSSLILKILDMFLQFENQYDGNVQEKAVHVLGLMIKATHGSLVSSYLSVLFSPLFTPGNEKYDILTKCDEYPSDFIDTVNSEFYSPTIYWNINTREDLLVFLRKEARTMRTSDLDYEYSESEVMKRFKNSRVTLNQQLVVVNVFIYQYIEYPFCEVDSASFINGVIDELSNRLPTFKNSKKDRDDFSALVDALDLYVKSNAKNIDAYLYTSILSFYIKLIRENIDIAQDKIIRTVEYMIGQTAGLYEFKRNNDATNERSYIVDLLASSYLISNHLGYAFRIAEIIRSAIKQDTSLMNTCYSAGGLFYGFYFIFNDVAGIDSKDSLSHIYLKIIQELIASIPDAARDAVEVTTSKFQNHFQNDAPIFKAFVKKSHEDVDTTTSSVRIWSDESREAIKTVIEDLIVKMNAETYMNENWDRNTMRCSLDDISKKWKGYTKTVVPKEQFRESPELGIKRMSTITRPSYSPPSPVMDRVDSD